MDCDFGHIDATTSIIAMATDKLNLQIMTLIFNSKII